VTDSKFQIEAGPDCNDGLLPEEIPGNVSATPDGMGAERVIRSVGLNTVYQVGSQVAPAIAAVGAIPFLLRRLGPEAFGIVTLFSTALIYFMMLDLGLGRAATRFIAQSLEGGRPDDVRRYFWGSILLLTGGGLVVSVGCLFLTPILVSSYLKISPAYYRATVDSFYLICIAIPLVALTATLRGLLEAWGRFPFISIVTACSGVGLYLLPALAVIVGGGLVSLAVTYVAVRVGMGAAFAIGCLSMKDRPSLQPIFDLNAVKTMLSFAGWLSVSNIIGTAMLYGDRFLLGSCVGMAAVASYSMPMDVIGRMQILITSFCAVLFPLMSRLDQSGSAQFHTVYRGAVAIGLSVMTPLAISMVLLAPFLMTLWLRTRNTPDAVFAAQVFLAGAVVQATASIAFTALHARGRSDLAARIHLAEFPVYCLAFYWAAVRFGVKGAALVWLARVIVDFVGLVVVLRLHKGDGRSVVTPELVAVLVSVGSLLTIALSTRNGVIMGCVICALTWLWTWRTLLDQEMQVPLARWIFGGRGR
jgi:O-antigen/teichoic acid export membrane protein